VLLQQFNGRTADGKCHFEFAGMSLDEGKQNFICRQVTFISKFINGKPGSSVVKILTAEPAVPINRPYKPVRNMHSETKTYCWHGFTFNFLKPGILKTAAAFHRAVFPLPKPCLRRAGNCYMKQHTKLFCRGFIDCRWFYNEPDFHLFNSR
jgi:hypothetical protein